MFQSQLKEQKNPFLKKYEENNSAISKDFFKDFLKTFQLIG